MWLKSEGSVAQVSVRGVVQVSQGGVAQVSKGGGLK